MKTTPLKRLVESIDDLCENNIDLDQNGLLQTQLDYAKNELWWLFLSTQTEEQTIRALRQYKLSIQEIVKQSRQGVE